MGTYVNPGNAGFATIVADTYVDKTGIIALVNETLNTPRKLVCVTRPRRFGKSFAAASVVAYYSCGCDSADLFDGLEISRSQAYSKHLNAYNVVSLDMTEFRGFPSVAAAVRDVLLPELREILPTAGERQAGLETELNAALLDVVRHTGRKFVFVVDEWDAPLREALSEAAKEEWVMFLRRLFKNASFTAEGVAAAYMTGILPIKRYGTQSALSDFREFTMLNPGEYVRFIGFNEDDVARIAADSGMDIELLRSWYDGYVLPEAGHVYAPFSVMEACSRGQVDSYWVSSESFDSLRFYIDMDFDGLQQDIVQALGGAEIPVRTGKFQNDVSSVASADDVLTLLIHLGYLAYDFGNGTARIPNKEVGQELRNAVEESRHAEVARIVRESDNLLAATWELDSDAVAEAIGRVHNGYTAPLYYNGEQALRAVVKAAYISAADHYAQIDELPGGVGFADIAFIPKRASSAPAMIIELKWNETPEAAMAQMRERSYADALSGWGGPTLLVAITYDRKTKQHSCLIQEA